MKMKTKKSLVLLLCGVAALVAGCRQNELDIPDGKVLKAVIEGGETRTSFDSYEGKFAWTPNDQLAVYYSDGTKSIATVATDGTVEVPASTASRYRSYYAVYPASVVEDITDGSEPLVVKLPYSYDISNIVANASGNPGADFSPLPMVAQNDEDNDILMFYHVGGLLRITLKGVKVGTKQVLVMFDKGVTGSFAVSNPGTDHPTISAAEPESFTNNIVIYTVDNTDEGIRDSSKPIVLNVPVPCGIYNTVSVSTMGNYVEWKTQTYDGAPLTFKRHHGKKLSFGDLTVDFAFGTDNGSGSFVALNNAEVEYTGGDGTLSANFVSYKTDGTTKEPVPFTLEYSEDDGTTWNTSAPSWLTPGTIDLDGSTTGQSVIYTAAPQVDTWENPHPGNLRAKGTRTQAFDLSKYNVATGLTTEKSRTANCYVVDRPGLYKFPLVYGNGIDWEKNPTNNGINEDAYHSRVGVNGAYRPDADTGVGTNSNYSGMDEIYWSFYIGRFRDHLDQYINSPYIATQQSGKSLTATLVWEDVQGLVTDVDIQQGVSGEDTYLTFRVPSETIDQGNALVAVLADGKIAWSWHIWVTEEDLTDGKAAPSGYLFAPVNLGWCDGKEEDYAPRTCKVRATQEGTGNTYTAIFTQTGAHLKFLGNNPFYEWGRKDPMQAWNGKEDEGPKTYYPFSEAYAPQSVLEKTTLGGSIQNPFVFYSAWGKPTHSWCSTDYVNLWSNNLNGTQNVQTEATVSKTVYDPSPVGYHVPPVAAFDGFTTSNLLFRRENGIPGWFYDNSLLFPVTGHLQYVPTQPYYTGLTTNRFYSWAANSALHHGTGFYAGAWRENSSVVVTNSDGSKDVGQPVRPVKD